MSTINSIMATVQRRQVQQTSASCGRSDSGQSHLAEQEDEPEDAFITFTTTESRCEQLYEKGMELKSQGQLEDALSCLLECLSRMQECQYFAKLAQTLHQLAELHHTLERYDKAVEFEQAEKLFYEAVIVDLQDPDKREVTERKSTKKNPKGRRHKHLEPDLSDSYGDLLILKADEFEKLARLCAQEKKFQLALDYFGKAVKIRQSVFGPDHPVTTSSLEYFTVLYAEMGRKQYNAALQQVEQEIDPLKSANLALPPGPTDHDKEAFDQRLSENSDASVTPLCGTNQDTSPKQDEKQSHDLKHLHSQNSPTAIKEHAEDSTHTELNQGYRKPYIEQEELNNYYFVGSPGTVIVRTLKSIPLWLIAFAMLAQLVIVVFFIR